MGGQIMPPVMGAVAFIMAETLGVDYSVIVKAAVIPAMLYFASAFWMVHLEAGKYGLKGMARDQMPSPLKALQRKAGTSCCRWPRWSICCSKASRRSYAGTIGLSLTVVLILGASITLGFSRGALRVIFWIGLALIAGTLMRQGLDIMKVALLVAALVLISALTKGGRATLVLCRDSLAESAKSALTVGMACAIVGTIIGMMTQTGVGTVLRHMGNRSRREEPVPRVGADDDPVDSAWHRNSDHSHLHHYGGACRAGACQARRAAVDQPHVCVLLRHHGRPLAAGGAGGAGGCAHRQGKSRQDRLGGDAHRAGRLRHSLHRGLRSPALMLQGSARTAFGYPVEVAWVVFTTCLAIGLWGAAAIGYFRRALSLFERALALLAAILIVGATPLSGSLGVPGGAITLTLAGVALGLGLLAAETLAARNRAPA
jgi:TRAP-type uncharacterized transport system fused permease subunit